jgi:tetratricopeptide (TPR) repeat protein
VKKEGSNGADNNARSQTRGAEVKLTERRHGLGGILGLLVGIGITVLLLFLLSPDLAFGDPPSEATPTPDGVPTPQKNTSGLDRLIEGYTSVIRDTPNSANAYALRGATKYAKGDLEGALADVEQALLLDPHCSSALGSRATIRQKKGDFNGAIEDLTKLTSETPKAVQAWGTLGVLRWNKGDLDEALHAFNVVIGLAPNMKEALQYRAAIYMRRFAYHDALQDSNRALDLDPTFTLALASRAECELQLNILDAARQDYIKALALDPVSAIALQGLGLVALHAQDPKTALTYFNRAIQLNVYPPPYISRAVAEIALESYHDAILDLSQEERLDPRNQDGPETLLWVARALNGDLDAANAELRAYLTERKSTDAWGLTRARFLLDEIDEDLFLRKIARGPGELCEAYFYSGIKRLLIGDKSGAMVLFDTCTRFEIRGFVEDQLARIQMKELTEKPDGE